MWPIIFGVSLIKSFRPFFKQHIVQTITDWEFLFLNSLLIAVVSFAYAYLHKKENIVNIFRLSYTQYLCAFILACMTIGTSLAIFKMQENGIITSVFLLKAVSSILFIGAGIFIFEEKLTYKQLLGILFVIIGLFLIK
jgi:drug/metabolite transporter (DMT)-like permease